MLELVGRHKKLFEEDISTHGKQLDQLISSSRFLVLGGAGSIGQAVTKEIFKRHPKKLHVVDLSENNLVELIRDIRSSFGYIEGEFKTFALDIGSSEYDAYWENDGEFDYVLNLSALKHVRSEKDPFTLMRMISTNILNTEKTLKQCINKSIKKYFCVSTDKAANPVNMMGASKRIMELFIHRRSTEIEISMARFANVAFSDGSLLHGFNKRLEKQQPIAAPSDVKRYFVTPQESGELCLMACIFGENRDIFFPKLNANLNLITFSEIAVNFLKAKGLKPLICDSEAEARQSIPPLEGTWPCFFSESDTTGEKDFEEFFTDSEQLDLERFINLGIIKNKVQFDEKKLAHFETEIAKMKSSGVWSKAQILNLFFGLLPHFIHEEKGKFLDTKM